MYILLLGEKYISGYSSKTDCYTNSKKLAKVKISSFMKLISFQSYCNIIVSKISVVCLQNELLTSAIAFRYMFYIEKNKQSQKLYV